MFLVQWKVENKSVKSKVDQMTISEEQRKIQSGNKQLGCMPKTVSRMTFAMENTTPRCFGGKKGGSKGKYIQNFINNKMGRG